MRPRSTTRSVSVRLARRLVYLATALVLLTAAAPAVATGPAGVTPASSHPAAGPGAYGIAPGTGTFAVLTRNNIRTTPGAAAEMYYLSTDGTGLNRLPFPLKVYNQTYRQIAISSNGNVQFGITSPGGNSTSVHECIPTTTDFGAAVAFVLWGVGLRYDTAGGEGIFLKTHGRAPNRTFTISWQGEFQVSADAPANAQVTFRENSRTLTYTYAETVPQIAMAIGIQSQLRDSYTERYCNGHGVVPTNGTRLTLGYVSG
jgi:hypothetical protein